MNQPHFNSQSPNQPEFADDSRTLQDEAWVSSLLFSISVQSSHQPNTSPDPEFLTALRDSSLHVFMTEQSKTVAPLISTSSTPSVTTQSTPPTNHRSQVKHSMKALITCIAGIIVALSALFTPLPQPSSNPPSFGKVLDALSTSPGLAIHVPFEDGAIEIDLDREGNARLAAPNGRSEVVTEGSIYSYSSPTAHPSVRPTGSSKPARTIDEALMDLVGVDHALHSSELRQRKPAETVQRDGRRWHRYQFRIATPEGDIDLDAEAAVESLQLGRIVVHTAVSTSERATQANTSPLFSLMGQMEQAIVLQVAQVDAVKANREPIVVKEKLADDGRTGTITESQGIARVRAAGRVRWTPVMDRMTLFPGDEIETMTRGANATTVRLESGAILFVGPGTQLAIPTSTTIQLLRGEVGVEVGEGPRLTLTTPGNQTHELNGKQYFRLEDRELVVLKEEPRWLTGYKNSRSRESLGMLEAKIDSRPVPLTVRSCQINVTIRDQIAQTDIVESFYNQTDLRLEGTFTFPLPADASISGFGMWVNGELVEADVVEKQRAREIYETILAEKRDPGLLEWTGGNLFRASVYPIEARSEKKIRISYTQVLPARNASYRYLYPLQSDLLREHPVGRLGVNVVVESTLPLRGLQCPSHAARLNSLEHHAQASFQATQYTPQRDFELVVATEPRGSELVVIPHRRGDDGYFLAQLTLPNAGTWKRELLPDGEPLDVILVADTSASMDRGQRKQQHEFIVSLLSSLTPRDRFNVAASDVACQFAFSEPQMATAETIERVTQFLENRPSLGWTDLTQLYETVKSRCGKKTQVVYLGDGIPSSTFQSPIEVIQQVTAKHQGNTGTFHAVGLGSTYELPVLQAISQLGSGTLRFVSQESPAPRVAGEFLKEILQPGLVNPRFEFRGIPVAAVYPKRLANLPVGQQQIVLGRFPTDAKVTAGEVVVTGELDGRPTTFKAPFVLDADGNDNSFVPRLWARYRLDDLLEQGQTTTVKDDIIALSEEFNIMTPYTSLLVLDSDADRVRFKVKRRFRMRDGERFFQSGRDNAQFELAQQQMQKAGNWRLGMRDSILKQFAKLGRNPSHFSIRNDSRNFAGRLYKRQMSLDLGDESYDLDFKSMRDSESTVYFSEDAPEGREFEYFGTPSGARGGGSMAGLGGALGGENEFLTDHLEMGYRQDLVDEDGPVSSATSLGGLRAEKQAFDSRFEVMNQLADNWDFTESDEISELRQYSIGRPRTRNTTRRSLYDIEAFEEDSLARGISNFRSIRRQAPWLETLIPFVPPLVSTPASKPERSVNWSEDAYQLANSILKSASLEALTGGISIDRVTETFDPERQLKSSESRRQILFTPKSWVTTTQRRGTQSHVAWSDEKERGVLGLGFEFGSVRKSNAFDLSPEAVFEFSDYSLRSLADDYRGYEGKILGRDGDKAVIRIFAGSSPVEIFCTIDVARHVLLEMRRLESGKLVSQTLFKDFVETAAGLIASEITTTDGNGKLTSKVSQRVSQSTLEEMGRLQSAAKALRETSQIVTLPLPTVVAAKKTRGAVGTRSFESSLVLLTHFSRSQRWARVDTALAECRQLAKNPKAMAWIEEAVWQYSRRHEQLRIAMPTIVDRVQSRPEMERLYLAQYALSQANVFESNETLSLLQRLEPIFESQPAYVAAQLMLRQARIGLYQQTGRVVEALRLSAQAAKEAQSSASQQVNHSNLLYNHGDYEAAIAWIDQSLNNQRVTWSQSDRIDLLEAKAWQLQQQGRLSDALRAYETIVELGPENYYRWLKYLSTMQLCDREEQLERTVLTWLREASQPAPLKPIVYHRGQAAIYFCLGQRNEYPVDSVEDRWVEPLATLVRQISQNAGTPDLVDMVLNDYRFGRKSIVRKLRMELFELYASRARTLSHDWIGRFHSWTLRQNLDIPTERWTEIATILQSRWKEEVDKAIREKQKTGVPAAFANIVVQVLQQTDKSQVIPFLRRQIEEGYPEDKLGALQSLFNELVQLEWTQESEDELFSLVDRLIAPTNAVELLYQRIEQRLRLIDRLIERREALSTSQLPNLNTLPRRKQEEERSRIAKEVRASLATRLAKERRQLPAEIGLILELEELHLRITSEEPIAMEGATVLELLKAIPQIEPDPIPPQDLASTEDGTDPISDPNQPPAKPETAEERTQRIEKEMVDDQSRRLIEIRRLRLLTMLAHIACRTGAKPELSESLVQYVENAHSARPRRGIWKTWLYNTLIALDRPQELQARLRAWLNEENGEQWRVPYSRLLAELGDIPGAIALTEATEIQDELSPEQYQLLSDWYHAVGRRSDHHRAKIEVMKTLGEYQLSQQIYRRQSMLQHPALTTVPKVTEDDINRFQTLFEVSNNPAGYLSYIRAFYTLTRDFRLLAVLADSVIGHTAGKAYPFVEGMGAVLTEVRDEATADELFIRISEVRGRAKSAVDQRALDMLEALVARRAAEIRNQPGAAVERAVTSLKRVLAKQPLTPGEPRLLANFLASLGDLSNQPLGEVQWDGLTQLATVEPQGSFEWLHIEQRRAEIDWMSGFENRQFRAIDRLEAALSAYQNNLPDGLPSATNHSFALLIEYSNSRGRFVSAERLIQAQLAKPQSGQQANWLREQLFATWRRAFDSNAGVSIGKGTDLYVAMRDKMLDELATTRDRNHRNEVNRLLCSVFVQASQRKIPVVQEDIAAYAKRLVPELVARQTIDAATLCIPIANALNDTHGPREALAFLIDRSEATPQWQRDIPHLDPWNHYCGYFAIWLHKLGDIGDLDSRLLAIVESELRRDLRSGSQRNRQVFGRNYDTDRYWVKHEPEFVKVANEVVTERSDQSETIIYVANYLWHSTLQQDRAIEILSAAHTRKVLSSEGQRQLVQWLQQNNRYGESIAILEALTKQYPDSSEFVVWLARAYHQLKRPEEAADLQKKAEVDWKERKVWGEDHIFQLGRSCLEVGRGSEAIRLLGDAIAIREESRRDRGVSDGVLANYYTSRANAHAILGRTGAAVNDATAALVVCGNDQRMRESAHATLRGVLERSPDLMSYIKELDQETATTQTDRPAVRKALGTVLLGRNQPAQAKLQLQIASSLRPNDLDISNQLVACHDALNDPQGAIQQLIATTMIKRLNFPLYAELAKRYEAVGDSAAAERSRTSVVDLLPGDSDGYVKLAEQREQQREFEKAVAIWSHVNQIRPLDPVGRVSIARIRIEQEKFGAAREFVNELKQTAWPVRYNNLPEQIRELESRIPK